MSDAGGPGSARKFPGVALADLGDTEGFEKDGEENQLYAFQLSDGVYKRKKVTQARRVERCRFHMPSPDGFTRWRSLGASGLPLQPSNKRAGLWMWKFMTVRRDGTATQGSGREEWRYPAVLLYPRDDKRGRLRALHA